MDARERKEQRRARKLRARDLARQQGISLDRAFRVVDGKLTLEEARKREKQARKLQERRTQEKARRLQARAVARREKLALKLAYNVVAGKVPLEEARIQQERLDQERSKRVKARALIIQTGLPLELAVQVVDGQLTLQDAEEIQTERGAVLAHAGGINRGNFGNNRGGPWWAPRRRRRP